MLPLRPTSPILFSGEHWAQRSDAQLISWSPTARQMTRRCKFVWWAVDQTACTVGESGRCTPPYDDSSNQNRISNNNVMSNNKNVMSNDNSNNNNFSSNPTTFAIRAPPFSLAYRFTRHARPRPPPASTLQVSEMYHALAEYNQLAFADLEQRLSAVRKREMAYF